jgi:putative ABC transport system ATP-binding protein
MVFQSYAVWPHMDVFENVAYPLTIRHTPKSEIKARVEKVLAIVHLSRYAERLPSQLSGGQQQRVAIARALMNNPPVVFADEPTGNLDTKSSIEIMNLFTELSNEGITIVMVTHEDDIAAYAKRHVVMRDGKVMRDDRGEGGRKTTEEVSRLVKEALA